MESVSRRATISAACIAGLAVAWWVTMSTAPDSLAYLAAYVAVVGILAYNVLVFALLLLRSCTHPR